MGSVPPVPLCFLEPVLQAEYQRISDFVYLFIEFLELKTKTKKLLHTAVPKFLQEFLPEFHSSLDAGKKKRSVPRCAGPQRHGGGFGPQVLYIYIYIYIYMLFGEYTSSVLGILS